MYDEFIKAVIEEAKRKPLSCDEPENPNSLQPVIDESQQKRILKYIDIGKKEGARLLYGGNARGPGYYIEPTIFADVQDHHTIANEEIFG
jgi:acyl-CoA reductase-like NAD-dependent aldehyde dehydrogenase